jgi:cobyrinic acid a,c-diamide synthase
VTRALVVAAPASGSGKTTVATGLMAALRRRGTAVAPFKVGPDYIDPGYHTLAAGRPGRNLDPVLVGADRIAPLARHGSVGAELAVVEGVMGLFDGRIPERSASGASIGTAGAGSTADVAGLLGAPVLLVVDCRGQARSLAALLHGFRSFDPALRIGGVVLNRVGSLRHVDVLRAAADEAGLPVLGALPRSDGLAVPSRHLGLVTAAEHGGAATAAVDAMAELVAAHVDLDAVAGLAAPLPAGPVWSPADAVHDGVPERPARGVETPDSACSDVGLAGAGRPVVAVLGGPAFTFGYAEHVELIAAAGAEPVTVDPLHDTVLPAGTGALVLPGGFPEEHVADLAANAPLLSAVRKLAASGAPVHAECGGLLYLCETLDGVPMCGVLPAAATRGDRLTLGYRDAVALADSALFRKGARVSGHEFHHWSVRPRAGATAAWGWRGADPEGFVDGGVHASFLHTHPAGDPAAVARFVRRSRSGA